MGFFSLFENEHPRMNNSSGVNHSGNSDVDVAVNIDTTALAYAFATFLHATGNLNNSEFETMIQNLNNLIEDPQNANIINNIRPTNQTSNPRNSNRNNIRRKKSNNRVMMVSENKHSNSSLGVIHARVPAHQYKKF